MCNEQLFRQTWRTFACRTKIFPAYSCSIVSKKLYINGNNLHWKELTPTHGKVEEQRALWCLPLRETLWWKLIRSVQKCLCRMFKFSETRLGHTRHRIPEGWNLHQHPCKSLGFRKRVKCLTAKQISFEPPPPFFFLNGEQKSNLPNTALLLLHYLRFHTASIGETNVANFVLHISTECLQLLPTIWKHPCTVS